MKEGGRRAIIAAFLANTGIAIAKFVGFLFTRSASMLAESVHSVADAGNQGLLLLGGARARRKPTLTHPFGYGRERYFWAFVVALVLFSLGSLFAIVEGIEKLRHPHEVESVWWAVGILGVAIVLEIFSFRTAVVEANRVRGGASWWSFIRHEKEPELPVVVLEDTGALLGLVIAMAGVVLASVTGNPRFDALGSLTIGVLLGLIAVVLVIEMKSHLIGEGATRSQLAAIEGALASSPAIDRLIHLRTLHLGPDELLVAAKVSLNDGLDLAQAADVVNAAEQRLRATVPQRLVIYIEPDLYRASGKAAAH